MNGSAAEVQHDMGLVLIVGVLCKQKLPYLENGGSSVITRIYNLEILPI